MGAVFGRSRTTRRKTPGHPGFPTPIHEAIGRRVVHTVAKAFTQPGHALSYQHTIFAERDGAIVGMISGQVA
jgi:hypothetical protein